MIKALDVFLGLCRDDSPSSLALSPAARADYPQGLDPVTNPSCWRR
jgi:hypothetical protein